MDIHDFFSRVNWEIIATYTVPGKSKEVVSIDKNRFQHASQNLIKHFAKNGIYKHQLEALKHFKEGHHICVTTGTASGKSLVFFVAATELLASKPRTTVLAIYPLKALGREQEQRWGKVSNCSGLNFTVGRIDGQVPVECRSEIMRRSNVLVVTPDILHAWMLPNISQVPIRNFLQNLSLVVIDEVHSYTGVFGSNSAFLFRRLQHICEMLNSRPQFICASATVVDPPQHLRKLLGLECVLIGPELDTSPRYPLEILMVNPPGEKFAEIAKLLDFLASQTSSKFLAFVDSRKQTEHLATIVARAQEPDESAAQTYFNHLYKLNVLPYRAGLEENDRAVIQDRLIRGTLKGVVSTSALELGIDIPNIDIGVLVGVPASSTSLWQRIGRIGRHSPGTVIVINAGGVYDESVFKSPEMLLNRPPAESALYLQNPRIQYIHALCLARYEGEHDQLAEALNLPRFEEFQSSVAWPEGFMDLCLKERRGEIPLDLQSMKSEAGEDPSHVFPLRDVETQFRVEHKRGPEIETLGSLSHDQLMREAYPGAVYYYTTRPFRVVKILRQAKIIQVREEKRYTTRPLILPTLIFPNLTDGNIFTCKKYNELTLIECNLQVRESISGFKERRGPNEFTVNYPTEPTQTSYYFNLPRFTRNYFTTGTVLFHPSFSEVGLDLERIALILYEAFLIVIPFERADIGYAIDRLRAQRGPLSEGTRFITIFDQTYGSLRLSGRIIEEQILREVFSQALKIIENTSENNTTEIEKIIKNLYCCSITSSKDCLSDFLTPKGVSISKPSNCVKVICPGSVGLSQLHDNQLYRIEDVFFNPQKNELYYRGLLETDDENTMKTCLPVAHVSEIPGESQIGYYEYDTGEVKPAETPGR